MPNFTCRAVETKLHRPIVDIRIGKVMIILDPVNTKNDDAAVYQLAELINGKISAIYTAELPEGS